MRFFITKPHTIITTLTLVSVALVSFFVLATNTNAAPNYQMNYQGKLTNASNVAVADGTYNMRFWLLTTSSIATTSAVWTESLTGTNKVQVTNGLFSVMLGSTSPLTSVDFNQTLYLGVEIGGTSTAAWDGEMSPRKVLGTVPSAFEADRLDGLTSTQFVRTDATSSISASTADTLLSITQNGVGDILNLFDGTDEVFSVLDGGNVGIGTTSPSRKFTVGGDAWFGGNLTGTGTLSISGLATLGYASTTGLTVTNAYLTNATTSNLKVTGLTGSRALFTDANSLLTTSGVSQYLIDAITDETGTGSLVFSTNPLLAGFRSSASSTIGDGTGAGGLTIAGNSTTTGNVYIGGSLGIGTSSPSTKVEIFGSGSNPILRIRDENIVNGSGLEFIKGAGAFGAANGFGFQTGYNLYGDNNFSIVSGNQTSTSTRLVIQRDTGNVGIGTTTPSRKLTVQGGDFWLGGSLTATGTLNITGVATLGYASTTGLTTTNLFSSNSSLGYASSTSLTVSGNTYFGGLSDGCLSTVSGLVTSSGVACGSGSGTSDWELTAGGSAITPTSTVGIAVFASSTIGDGTGAGGLTINGNSTTTLNQYVAGASMVGSQDAFITDGYEFSASGRSFFYDAAQHTDYDLAIEHSGGPSYSGTVNATMDKSNGIDETLAPYHAGVYGTQNGKNTYALLGIRRIEATWDPTPTALTTGTYLPGIGFAGPTDTTDGSSTVIGASLGAIVDGAVSTGVLPTALIFHTSQSSSTLLTERMRITSTGTIGIGTTTPSKLLTVAGDIFTPNNISAGSSTITYASSTGLTATNATFTGATTSSLYTTTLGLNSEYFTDFTGNGLQNTSNALTCITSNSSTFGCLTSEDWSIFNNKVSSTSIDTSAELASLITDETGSAGNLVFSTNPLLAGFRSIASSTIGDGTGTGGLTINGNSTTTLNAYIGGTLSLGSTTPGAKLTIVGTGGQDLFNFSSSTGSSMLALDQRGVLEFGTTTSANIFLQGGPTSTSLTNTSLLSGNIAIGNQAFSYPTSTSLTQRNIAIGFQALYGSSSERMTGDGNVAIGDRAMYNNTTGSSNTALNATALFQNTTGSYNIALGQQALYNNTTGSTNVAQGFQAMINNSTGDSNVGIGASALAFSGAGSQNTAVGAAASFNTSGSQNSSLGSYAGSTNTAGNSNTHLGYYADGTANNFSTSTAIGAMAKVGCSNCLVLGGTGADYANVGIGTTTPSRLLTVQGGDAWFGGNITGTGTLSIAGGATSSSLYTTTLGLNSEYFTDLTGSGLQNTSNALTCITSNSSTFGCLTSEDWSIFNNKVSSSSIDTSAELASLITDETGSAGNLVFSGNPLLAGFRSSASSTIGDGTGAGGLTINGSATTTGGSYIAGGTMRIVNGTGNTYGTRNDGILFARSDFPTTFQNKISNSFSGVAANTSMNFELTNTTGTGHVAALSLFGTGDALFGKDIGLGTTTPTAYLTIGTTTLSGAVVGGIKQYLGFVNSTESAVYYGDETYISNVPTATSTLVGNMIRIADTSTLGNTVRGFEAQAFRGTNTKGENTGLSGFGRTFGVRGTTIGDAGDTFIPAGVFAESQGTTQGNALRAYSGTITTEELVSLFHDTGNFTGTGLQMNFGNAGGSFAATSSAKFVDFQVAGTSKFIVAANGSTTIGDGVTSASLRIPFGGICVDNDGSCISTTTGQIRSVTSALGNSDLAETYFSNQTLHAGEIVAISGGLSIKRAQSETEKDIIGVVSTKPGLTLGFDDTSLIPGERSYPIGLKGRVPIKLSTENGPIKKGDRIALSSIPGVGMKATESSRVVGIALEDYDGTRAYTAGFLNQFGDDMYKEKVTAQKNLDLRAQDGCSYGGGSALGEEECVAKTVSPIQAVTAEVDTTREDTLRAFARESALQTTSGNGEVAYVGQALMFIELTNYHIADETRMLSELASSTLLQNGAEGETIWSRVKALAQNFVDGVLTVTGIKADRVDVADELCVDGVCVNADDLRAILQNAHQGSQNTNTNTNTNTGDGGASGDSGTTSPPPRTEDNNGDGGNTTDSLPGVTEEPPTEIEPPIEEPLVHTEEEQQPEEPPLEPEPEPAPEPEPPAPEPTI
jgi:hypothetical protein